MHGEDHPHVDLAPPPFAPGDSFVLTDAHRRWLEKRRQGASSGRLRTLLVEQQGRCALSGARMIFDVGLGTPVKGDAGCHPLYPAVDHIDPGNADGGYQIVCYALNDLKGHLPVDCFRALSQTEAWQRLMEAWRQLASAAPSDRVALYRLLRPNATPRGR